MADLEKVIKAAEDYEPYARVLTNLTVKGDLFLDMLALLKSQEPVAPIIEVADLKTLGVDDKDITPENIDKWTFRWCGNCNNLLLRTDKFCNKCGRQVKW